MKGYRLYNVLFPVWYFFLFPTWLWFLILPANFLIDSLVVYLSGKHLKVERIKEVWRKSILRVWLFGFLSDFIGAFVSLGIYMIAAGTIPDAGANLVLFPGVTLASIPGVVIAGFLIYLFNLYWSFKKTDLTLEEIRKISLYLAVFTAPWVMLIPLYG